MQTDKALIDKAKMGDHAAFQKLVERYEQQVRAMVIGMLGQTPETDEVAQDVFIRFYKALKQFKGESKLGTYLGKIAINLSLNELKRRKKHKSRWVSIFQKKEQVLQLKDRTDNFEKLATKNVIDSAIQQLEPEFRVVVMLRLVQGYSVKETAEMLELPMGTIASRLARAQKKLQQILNPIFKND